MPTLDKQYKSLLPKGELNPKLWKDEKLDPEIKANLIRIAVDFAKEANVDLSKIRDIIITGSSANYNWSKYSDIDLHLVVEYDDFSDDSDLIKDYFTAKKTVWNNEHDITIKGHEVETYIQDEDEPHYASGVYSLKHDKWLSKPDHISVKNVDKHSVLQKAKVLTKLVDSIKEIFDDGDYEKAHSSAERMKAKIRKMRKHGLEKAGEFSVENLAFKLLRRNGSLEKLSDVFNESYDKLRSIK